MDGAQGALRRPRWWDIQYAQPARLPELPRRRAGLRGRRVPSRGDEPRPLLPRGERRRRRFRGDPRGGGRAAPRGHVHDGRCRGPGPEHGRWLRDSKLRRRDGDRIRLALPGSLRRRHRSRRHVPQLLGDVVRRAGTLQRRAHWKLLRGLPPREDGNGHRHCGRQPIDGGLLGRRPDADVDAAGAAAVHRVDVGRWVAGRMGVRAALARKLPRVLDGRADGAAARLVERGPQRARRSGVHHLFRMAVAPSHGRPGDRALRGPAHASRCNDGLPERDARVERRPVRGDGAQRHGGLPRNELGRVRSLGELSLLGHVAPARGLHAAAALVLRAWPEPRGRSIDLGRRRRLGLVRERHVHRRAGVGRAVIQRGEHRRGVGRSAGPRQRHGLVGRSGR